MISEKNIIIRKIRASRPYKEWRDGVVSEKKPICSCQCGCGLDTEGFTIVHHIENIKNILERCNIKTFEEAMFCKDLWDKNNAKILCSSCHYGDCGVNHHK